MGLSESKRISRIKRAYADLPLFLSSVLLTAFASGCAPFSSEIDADDDSNILAELGGVATEEDFKVELTECQEDEIAMVVVNPYVHSDGPNMAPTGQVGNGYALSRVDLTIALTESDSQIFQLQLYPANSIPQSFGPTPGIRYFALQLNLGISAKFPGAITVSGFDDDGIKRGTNLPNRIICVDDGSKADKKIDQDGTQIISLRSISNASGPNQSGNLNNGGPSNINLGL